MSRWGPDKTLKFIRKYRECDCLWNTKSPEYKDKNLRVLAYQKLYDAFNDGSMTVQDIKNRIKNFRTIYHQELKKIRTSRCSGGEVYVPRLSWFVELHEFLAESLEYRDGVLADLSSLQYEEDQETQIDFIKSETSSNNEQTFVDETDIASMELVVGVPEKITTKTAKSGKIKRKTSGARKSIRPNTMQNMSERVKTPEIATRIDAEDEFYYFGLNVAAQLRELPLNNALSVQTKIQNLLFVERRKLMTLPSTSYGSL